MSKKVFVVEDDQKNLNLFLAILDKIPNLDVIAEKDGKKAFKQIKEIQPDIIILDIQLPEMSGIEICIKLREINKFKTTPIIAITAFAMKGDKERIIQAGFDKYLSKPINVKELRDYIINAMKKNI